MLYQAACGHMTGTQRKSCRVCELISLSPGTIMAQAPRKPPSRFRQTIARITNRSHAFHTYPDDAIPTTADPGSEWMLHGDPIGLRIIHGLEGARNIEWKGPQARSQLTYRTGNFYRRLFHKVARN